MWNDHDSRSADGDNDEVVASSYAGSHSGCTPLETVTSPLQSSDIDSEDSYDEDAFDDYSDEFEADDDDGNGDASEPESVAHETNNAFFSIGDRVQVYWDEETEWFDGSIAQTEAGRCYVRYDDGEEQWEHDNIIRPAPSSTFQRKQQLQLVADDWLPPIGQGIITYWQAELSWFGGSITDTTVTDGILKRIHVVYDDGDHQWIARAAFRDVLLVASAETTQLSHLSLDQSKSIETGTERYLTPRKYTPVLATHFEPVRIARPYRSSVQNHIGSVITPRPADDGRRPFYSRVDIKLDFQDASHPASSQLEHPAAMRDCELQTEITIGLTLSA